MAVVIAELCSTLKLDIICLPTIITLKDCDDGLMDGCTLLFHTKSYFTDLNEHRLFILLNNTVKFDWPVGLVVRDPDC